MVKIATRSEKEVLGTVEEAKRRKL